MVLRYDLGSPEMVASPNKLRDKEPHLEIGKEMS